MQNETFRLRVCSFARNNTYCRSAVAADMRIHPDDLIMNGGKRDL